ncbi:hypothetical protein ACQKDB_16075 [Planococcus kocurii]|uniref:hypothetical protein n=1 Tax=Planococcus kocurii TaxID=1374 RepID=UPI003CFD4DF4
MDVLMDLYNVMIADEFIAGKVRYTSGSKTQYRIKFQEYPATGDVNGAYIVIDPISAPIDTDFADDVILASETLLDIDVWTKKRTESKELSDAIKKLVKEHGYYAFGGAPPEYDKSSGIHRDMRRYRKKVNSEEY